MQAKKQLKDLLFEMGFQFFMREEDVTGLNRKYQKMYKMLAPGYDLFEKIVTPFMYGRGGQEKARREFLKELEIDEGDDVLEVSIGTGINLKFLSKTAHYYGLDISWGMLEKCKRNIKKWGVNAELFLGEAESLPFIDEAFDVVWHVGDINFFYHKAQAIREMIRVAKPRTKIVIVDETEKHSKNSYERTPIVRRFYKNRKEPIAPPIDLVPEGMLEVQVEEILDCRLFCLCFRKP